MIQASQARGNITLAMLFGHASPLAGSTSAAPRCEHHYPPHLSRSEQAAMRRQYMHAYLNEWGASTCRAIGDEFGVISEVAYKDLSSLRADRKVRTVQGSKPTLWEACE